MASFRKSDVDLSGSDIRALGSSALKMKAEGSSETLVYIFQITGVIFQKTVIIVNLFVSFIPS
jgi:hypothetical protein